MTVVVAISCQELVELVTDYLEGALTPAELRRFEDHIATCGKCTEYLAQLRATIRVTGMLTPAELTSEAEATLVQVFRTWANG